MSDRQSDSHPDVPEDATQGVRGDPGEIGQNSLPKPVSLPPRRTTADPRRGKLAADAGLRIESSVSRSDSSRRLEVTRLGGDVIRLEQAEDRPAKVERQITFHEKPVQQASGKNASGEGRDWGNVRRHPVRWILGMGLGVTLLIVVAFLLLPLINSTNAPKKGPNDWALTIEEVEEVEGMEAMEKLLTELPEAMQIFRAYAQATLVEEVVPLIMNGKSMEDTIQRYWEPLRMPSSWVPHEDSLWSVDKFSGRAYGVLEGELLEYRKFAAFFTRQDGRLVMDWKATAAFGTAPFSKLAEGKGDASEVRGEISAADYYSAAWPETRYRSFRLAAPNGEVSIWCYLPIGAPGESVLAPLLNQGEILGEATGSMKVTVRLVRGAPESLPNQWLVGEVLRGDWTSP